ncbi:MAG: ATP synthase F1 subunit epsilon [Eubacterium sp.]
MEDNKLFSLRIITPNRIFYEGSADFVEMVTSEGEIGVYKNHISMTSILQPGILKIHNGDEVKEAALHAGFVTIFPDEVNVMAEIAEWPDEIDLNRAKEAKIRAERRLGLAEGRDNDWKRAEMALKKAVVRINVVETK